MIYIKAEEGCEYPLSGQACVCKYVTSKTVHQKEKVPNAYHFNNIQPLNNEKDWLGQWFRPRVWPWEFS